MNRLCNNIGWAIFCKVGTLDGLYFSGIGTHDCGTLGDGNVLCTLAFRGLAVAFGISLYSCDSSFHWESVKVRVENLRSGLGCVATDGCGIEVCDRL